MLQFAPGPRFPDSRPVGQFAEAALPVKGFESFHDIFLRVNGQGYGTTGSALDIQHAVGSIILDAGNGPLLSATTRGLRLWESLANVNRDAPDPSVLCIPLSRLGFSSVADWPSAELEKLLLRVLINTLPANSGGNPALTLTALENHVAFEELPQKLPLGEVFTFHTTNITPVAGGGWTVIDNLPVGNLRALTKMLFYCPLTGANLNNTASNAITQVRVSIGRKQIYDSTKQLALAQLCRNPLYRSAHPDGTPLEMFPVVFDQTGRPADYVGLVDGNTRRTVKVELYWNPAVTVEAVQVLIEGLAVPNGAPLVASV